MLDEKELRQIYCDKLLEMAAKDKNIVVFEADLMSCHATKKFKETYSDRFFDVGVAEANMIGIASGMATYGKIPFCASFGPFATRRCYDQIFISVAYAKQNVKIVGTDPGISAEMNGGTHMPFEDMGIMRSIPDMVCVEITDNAMMEELMEQIAYYKGPVYMRMFRKKTEKVYEKGTKFDLFKANIIKKGNDCTIIASGIMVSKAIAASELLEKEGINVGVINTATWKPIDKEAVINAVKESGCLVVAENHNVHNGLGSAVSEVTAEYLPTPIEFVGVKDKFGEVGKMDYLATIFNLRTEDIINAVKKVMARK